MWGGKPSFNVEGPQFVKVLLLVWIPHITNKAQKKEKEVKCFITSISLTLLTQVTIHLHWIKKFNTINDLNSNLNQNRHSKNDNQITQIFTFFNNHNLFGFNLLRSRVFNSSPNTTISATQTIRNHTYYAPSGHVKQQLSSSGLSLITITHLNC